MRAHYGRLMQVFQDGMDAVGSTAILVLFDGAHRFFVRHTPPQTMPACLLVWCRC